MFTHDELGKSWWWGTHSRMILVLLFTSTNFINFLSPSWESFLLTSFVPPQNTSMSLNVRLFVSSVTEEVSEVMSTPGFKNPMSKSSLRLYFILLAETCVWLSPTIMIFCFFSCWELFGRCWDSCFKSYGWFQIYIDFCTRHFEVRYTMNYWVILRYRFVGFFLPYL